MHSGANFLYRFQKFGQIGDISAEHAATDDDAASENDLGRFHREPSRAASASEASWPAEISPIAPNLWNLCKKLASCASHLTEKGFQRISPKAVGSGVGVGSGIFRRNIADMAKFLKSIQKVCPECIPPDREGYTTDFTESRRKRCRHRKWHIPPNFGDLTKFWNLRKKLPPGALGQCKSGFIHKNAVPAEYRRPKPTRNLENSGKLPHEAKFGPKKGQFLGYDPSDFVCLKKQQQNLGHVCLLCFKRRAVGPLQFLQTFLQNRALFN